MKKVWNELKLKFKEQLRITGKFDINPADSYLVKRRRYEDIDIAKDFEKRLRIKTKEDQKEYIKDKSLNFESMSLQELEEYRKEKVMKEEEEKKSDLYQKIILGDIK